MDAIVINETCDSDSELLRVANCDGNLLARYLSERLWNTNASRKLVPLLAAVTLS